MHTSLLQEIVVMAATTIRTQKMRSALTILGIVIGITSIVGMTALIRGFDESLRDSIRELGPETMFIAQVSAVSFMSGAEFNELLKRPTLTPADARAIERQAESIGAVSIMIGEGPGARSIKLELPPFTLVGATTRAGLLTSPLRDRFGIVQRLEFYGNDELIQIVKRTASIFDLPVDDAGAREIAARSRGTPRIANRLLRRVRDYTEVEADGRVTQQVAQAAMDLLEVDPHGFDSMDRKLLLTVIEKFDGGPVGIESLAAAIGEERGTLEDVVEPFLIQEGFLQRTSRGRMATRNAYLHYGLQFPQAREGSPASPGLFD